MSKNTTSSGIGDDPILVVKKESSSDFIAGVYEENRKKLERLAIRKGSRPEDAADIVNSAFCNFIKYLRKYEGERTIDNPFSFLGTTINRLIIDAYRKQPQKLVGMDDVEGSQLSDNGRSIAEVDRDMDNCEYFEALHRHYMEDFSERETDLLRYMIVCDLKAQDIAAILGEDHKETYLDCNRAMGRLRARIRTELANQASDALPPG